jgi:hypothetical protein
MERYSLIPRQLTWTSDILSVLFFISVVFLIIHKRTINISIAYIILFAILFLHILFGIILNAVSSGAVFQGIRVYLKYIPFFLLPLVYDFSEKNIKNLIYFLLVLTLLQLPIALYQRLIQGAGIATGDYVIGSLATSSLLSIYLICAYSMCISFYFKKLISAKIFLIIGVAILIPTTINETKGTLFLLPFALLVPALISGTLSEKIKRLVGSLLIGMIFIVSFAVIYDTYMSSRYGENAILTFFTTENRVEGYLAPQSSGLRTNLGPGRIDQILAYFSETSDDPIRLAFGYGLANLSRSFLGAKFSGEFMDEYGIYIESTASQILWELGIIGTLLIIFLLILIFRDARRSISYQGITGGIALGITGILGVFILGVFYKNIMQSAIISTIFWFLAGYIAAKGNELKYNKTIS